MSDHQTPREPADRESPELSDDVISALRNIPSASDSLRDEQIAVALREIAPRARRRLSPISIAASFILVVAVGATLFARTGENATPVLAAHSITPFISTKGNTAATYDQELGASTCQYTNNQIFGVYLMDTQTMKLAWQDNELSVLNGDTCDVIAEFKRPVGRAPLPTEETKACSISLTDGSTFLADTVRRGYMYQVFATNTELVLFDCATSQIVDRIPHPNPEVPLLP